MDTKAGFDQQRREKNLETIAFMEQIKNAKASDVEKIGWAYWTISDKYAILRQPEEEYRNHLAFVEWGKSNLYPDKLHWFVSDATQALTLSIGNHFAEWFSWYLYACKHSSRTAENRGARFQSYRAAIAALLKLNKLEKIDIPLKHLSDLLAENDQWNNALFARLSLYGFRLEKAFKTREYPTIDAILVSIDELIRKDVIPVITTDCKDQRQGELLGSWKSLNAPPRNIKQNLLVAIHNLACSLHISKQFAKSLSLFALAMESGLQLHTYGLALYLLSLWNVEKDKYKVKQIYEKLSTDKVNLEGMYKFAPELQTIFASLDPAYGCSNAACPCGIRCCCGDNCQCK